MPHNKNPDKTIENYKNPDIYSFRMQFLEKIKKFLHPDLIKEIEIATDDEEVIQKLTVYFTKLIPFIDLFIRKETILDALLTQWDQKKLTELKTLLTELKATVTSEFGSLENFKKETNETYKTLNLIRNNFLYSESNRKARYNLIETQGSEFCQLNTIGRLYTLLFFLETTYKKQLELISEIGQLSDSEKVKINIFKFVNAVSQEFWALGTIFGIESKYAKDFEKLLESPIADLADAPANMNEKEKDILASFIKKCIKFIIEKKVHMVLVTESSARILGIILLDQLRSKKIKDVVVASFNPAAQNFVENFIQQRKALTAKIQENKKLPILIVDEFSSGTTLGLAKTYFEKIGAQIVYTASAFRGDPKKINIVGDNSREPSWYGKQLLQRFKIPRDPNTRPENKFILIEKHPKYIIMNDLHIKLLKDYKDFMKKIASKKTN